MDPTHEKVHCLSEQNKHITRMFHMAVSGGCVGIIYHPREHTVLLGTPLKHTLCLENTEVSLNFHIQTPCHSHRTLSLPMFTTSSINFWSPSHFSSLLFPGAFSAPLPSSCRILRHQALSRALLHQGSCGSLVGLGLTHSSDWTVYETNQPFSC